MLELRQTETFRKWYAKLKDTLVVLLCGGDKSSQARDIKSALRLAEQWSS